VDEASDDELYRRYRAGNGKAFDLLYERYRQPVYNYVRKSISSNKVDELYQDIWVKVVAAANNYKDTGKFRQWIFTCAHNLIVDEYRKNARADLVELPDLESRDLVSDDRVRQDIDRVLNELPLEQRQAFHLRHELGCAVAEIAAIQDCPVESAKSRLRYAYQKLKSQLQEYQP
jgi:RNA polymerase sigma-70 factor (ECF subfamily)